MTRRVFRFSPVAKWVAGSLLAAVFAATLPGGCQAVPQPTPTPDPTPTPEPTPTPAPTPSPRLFIANRGGNSVVSYENPATVNGNIRPDTNLSGAQTQLSIPADIVVNAAGQLIVANGSAPGAITTYDDAADANGNFEPDGNVKGPDTGLIDPLALALSPAADLLFVAEFATNVILVFANTSQSSFNGNTAPIRTITTATSRDLNKPSGLHLDANGNLYVSNQGANNILVFANAGALNGDETPVRIITSASFVNVTDVFIDGDDRMYALEFTGFVFMFNNAVALNGNEEPDIVLEVNPAINMAAIAVDSTGTGYLVDSAANAVFAYDDIASLNGPFDPDRTIRGVNTQLNVPFNLFLVESEED